MHLIACEVFRPELERLTRAMRNAPEVTYLEQGLHDTPDELRRRVQQAVDALEDGDVLLLENIRFDKREKKNDPAFCEELAALGEAYVNDAFGTAHRAHASTAGVAAYLPSYAGYLMEREVATLTGMLDEPRRPFVAILGGSKVSDKIKVIDALLEKADTLIIGGTSLVVYPAAGLIRYFRGDHLVVINMQPTGADAQADLCIAKPIGQVLSEDVVLE